MICMRCFVSGTVQGVWYRGSTRDKARELNLNGYVRNLDDGRVEVLACGDEAAVRALRDWLWEGPALARVKNVQSEVVDYREEHGFSVL